MNAITDCVVYCELREIRSAAGVWELFEETVDFIVMSTVCSEDLPYGGFSCQQTDATLARENPSFTSLDRIFLGMAPYEAGKSKPDTSESLDHLSGEVITRFIPFGGNRLKRKLKTLTKGVER